MSKGLQPLVVPSLASVDSSPVRHSRLSRVCEFIKIIYSETYYTTLDFIFTYTSINL